MLTPKSKATKFTAVLCFAVFLASLAVSRSANSVQPQASSRPKIYSLAFVQLRATDLARSKDFYGKSLGLKPGMDDCKGVSAPCFSVNPYQRVELVPRSSSDPRSFLQSVGFNINDVSLMRAYLASKDIESSEITRSANGLRFIRVEDPEKNNIIFAELSGSDSQVNGLHQVSDRMIHSGFVVSDRSAMDHFYKDILGFRPYWHGGMKDDETSWVSLQVPDGTDWIEYMLNIPATADQHLLGVMNHIALGVPDIHAAQKQLLSNGMTLQEEPKMGRDGKWQLNLYDPDQTRVEFMEFTPVEKPCCSEYTGSHPKP